MWRKQVMRLGAEYGIADYEKLLNALDWAGLAYDGEEHPFTVIDHSATDRLDQVAAALSLVTSQLTSYGEPNLNEIRLIDELTASSSDEFGATVEQFETLPGEAIPVMGTTGAWMDRRSGIEQKVEQWLDMAGAIQLAAGRAHAQRGRGAPRRNGSLRAAVWVLVVYWTNTLGRSFTLSKWEKTPEGVVPEGGELALFLCAAMKIIDPRRKRLGQELRNLMVTLKKEAKANKHKPEK